MADFPTAIFAPRTVENLPGLTYDATKKTTQFAEDYSKPAAEIVAVETALGVNPQGAYATVKAWLTALVSALSGKQDSLGFTPENVANKDTTVTLGTSDTKYPSQKAVKTYVDTGLSGKQASLGFTPENVANKDTTVTLGTSDTKYPSQKAVKTYVDALKTLLGMPYVQLSSNFTSVGNNAEQVVGNCLIALPVIAKTCTLKLCFNAFVWFPNANNNLSLCVGSNSNGLGNTAYCNVYKGALSELTVAANAVASIDLSTQKYLSLTITSDGSQSTGFSAYAFRTAAIAEIFG